MPHSPASGDVHPVQPEVDVRHPVGDRLHDPAPQVEPLRSRIQGRREVGLREDGEGRRAHGLDHAQGQGVQRNQQQDLLPDPVRVLRRQRAGHVEGRHGPERRRRARPRRRAPQGEGFRHARLLALHPGGGVDAHALPDHAGARRGQRHVEGAGGAQGHRPVADEVREHVPRELAAGRHIQPWTDAADGQIEGRPCPSHRAERRRSGHAEDGWDRRDGDGGDERPLARCGDQEGGQWTLHHGEMRRGKDLPRQAQEGAVSGSGPRRR